VKLPVTPISAHAAYDRRRPTATRCDHAHKYFGS
jgi:hypothetical protein